ncbi:MAG: hypothetical protein ACSNEK_09225 [Parachlamydiaceae bacterium]
MWILLFFLLLLASCGPSCPEDYKELGKQKTRRLLIELQKINNRDQLIDAEKTLIECYKEIADLMVSVEGYRRTHPDEPALELTNQDHELSDKLRLEILRICRFDGGREIMDSIRLKSKFY